MVDPKQDHLKVVGIETDDPYDPAKLRVSQDYLATANVKRLLTTVPVRRPGSQEFVRTHSSPAYRDLLAFLELRDDRETFLVNLAAVPELQSECFIATLHTAITRVGVVFLWPVRVPAVDGRTNNWHASAAEAAAHAMKSWVKMKANMALGAYEISLAENQVPEPEWPELSFVELYKIAFRDRLINTPDHPAIKRLRGA
jgi:hypothetical protein